MYIYFCLCNSDCPCSVTGCNCFEPSLHTTEVSVCYSARLQAVFKKDYPAFQIHFRCLLIVCRIKTQHELTCSHKLKNQFWYTVYFEKTSDYNSTVNCLEQNLAYWNGFFFFMYCIAGALVCKPGTAVKNQPAFSTNIIFAPLKYAFDPFLVRLVS